MDVVLFNIHDVVLLFTVLCCFICIAIFWQYDKSKLAFNGFMAAFFIASACIPIDILFNFGASFRPWALTNAPDIFFVFEYGYWIQAQLAYWMFKSILIKKFKFSRYDLLLVLPFVVAQSHQWVLYHSLSTELKVSIQSALTVNVEGISVYFIQLVRDGFRCVLAIYCFILVRQYMGGMPGARFGEVKGLWLFVLSVGLIVINVVNVLVALSLLLHVKSVVDLPFAALGLTNNYLTLLFFACLVVCYARSALPVSVIKPMCGVSSRDSKKKAVNPSHVRVIEAAMANEKIYRDTELTLEVLAEKVGLSTRTVSSVINTHYGCHFFEYVNRFRIEEAKRLLRDPECIKMTVLDVMYEAGFSGKATFNGFFKRVEGMTPSEFRRQSMRQLGQD